MTLKTKREILKEIIKNNVYWESEELEALPTDDFDIEIGVTDEGIGKIVKLLTDQQAGFREMVEGMKIKHDKHWETSSCSKCIKNQTLNKILTKLDEGVR